MGLPSKAKSITWCSMSDVEWMGNFTKVRKSVKCFSVVNGYQILMYTIKILKERHCNDQGSYTESSWSCGFCSIGCFQLPWPEVQRYTDQRIIEQCFEKGSTNLVCCQIGSMACLINTEDANSNDRNFIYFFIYF
jgi:hypothetical protein